MYSSKATTAQGVWRCCPAVAVSAALAHAGAGRIAVATGPVRDWCLEYGEHPAVWIMTELAWCAAAGCTHPCPATLQQQHLSCACIPCSAEHKPVLASHAAQPGGAMHASAVSHICSNCLSVCMLAAAGIGCALRAMHTWAHTGHCKPDSSWQLAAQAAWRSSPAQLLNRRSSRY